MKIVLLAFLFAAAASAQNSIANPAASCGPETVGFKVKTTGAPQVPGKPEPGKALLYFFHDSETDYSLGYPTVKLGIDGAWVGANHGDSFFAVPMNPGEHHLCATLQSSIVDQRVELAHLTAEAGKIYFYRTRLVLSGTVELLELDPIDSDQGIYLIATSSLSVSRAKKQNPPFKRFSDRKDTR